MVVDCPGVELFTFFMTFCGTKMQPKKSRTEKEVVN